MARDISQEHGFKAGDKVAVFGEPRVYEIVDIVNGIANIYSPAIVDDLTGESDSLRKSLEVPLSDLSHAGTLLEMRNNNSKIIH